MAMILVVDDGPTNRTYLTALLGDKGHVLLEAGDGAEGLELARARRPDLVITDILMPTMDGYEFVRRLRNEPTLAATPVVFHTAHYLERQARDLARACGVSHILAKGCEPEAILRAVDAALGLPAPAAPLPQDEFDRDHRRLLTDKLSGTTGELQAANERLAQLLAVNLELALERDPHRLLEKVCEAARSLLGARYAAVGVADEDGQSLKHFLTSGLAPEAAARLGAPPARAGALGQLLAQPRTMRRRNPGGDPAAVGLPAQHPPVASWLAAPLMSPSRVYGWLCLADKVGAEEFGREDERLAGILAAQAGRIYENGSLYADVLRHASDLEREVAERKRTEEALRESQRQERLLLDSTAEAIYGIDALGKCIFCNPACLRVLGYADGRDLLGKNMHALTHHTRADGSPYPIEECEIYKGYLQGKGAHRDDEVLWRADGSSFPAEYWSHPVSRDGRIVGSVVTFLDISERKNLEGQVRQAQKMDAIGRLAGGVAHDFNNLLTVINGYSELLVAGLPAGDPGQGFLQEIHKAGERAAALTRQLLAFSRKQVLTPVVLDLNLVVSEAERMLRRLIGEDVDLLAVLDPKLGRVRADPGQVEQVLLNLVVNARDAMPRGGRLTIETRNVELDADYAQSHAEVKAGRYVLLAVSDTGCGMNGETQARIFEPFFTTKAIGKGTGLGLATVYGVVKQSNGHLAVYSELGRGTTFKLYLPRTEEAAARGPDQEQFKIPPGKEVVLLVEDEDGVRTLARLILESCGYTVLEAHDGGEALRIVAGHKGALDLIVTDVVMPGMSGRELADALATRRPGLKVIFLSGYTEDAVVRHGVLERSVSFLEKPFTPAALARKVRDVLDH